MKTVNIYTDGSCMGNPGPGGWGFVVVEDDVVITSSGGGEYHTTNKRMEMQALYKSLKSVYETFEEDYGGVHVVVNTDCSYVSDAFNKGWLIKWQDNGWKNSEGQEVSNKDLWRKLLNYQPILSFQVNRIARNSSIFNIHADKIARSKAKEFKKEASLF